MWSFLICQHSFITTVASCNLHWLVERSKLTCENCLFPEVVQAHAHSNNSGNSYNYHMHSQFEHCKANFCIHALPQRDIYVCVCCVCVCTCVYASVWLHSKNRKIALTQVGLPQLQLHYQTMWIQADQLHCWSTIGLLCNFRHADG